MLAKSAKATAKGSGGGDSTLMELLAKMSEAYMKEKAEKTEVAARVATLEAENKTLKNQLTEARRREQEEKERSQEVCDRFYLLRFSKGASI